MLSAAALLGACEKELILPGERIDPRDVLAETEVPAVVAQSTALRLPGATANAAWPQRAGNAEHSLTNPALGQGTTLLFRAPIGEGSGLRHRITSDPVVAAGRIYTLDSRAAVAATSTAGATLWNVDLTPAGEDPNSASGGGVAYADGKLFVTTGFGEMVALDAATGGVIWRQKFAAPVGGAPTIANGLVYAVSRDGSVWAVRPGDGKVQWLMEGMPSPSAMTGVSAPAATSSAVVFPMPSGDLITTMPKGGLTLWQKRVSGTRLGRAYTSVRDVTGDPVIAGDTVYAATSAGRTEAFDLASGDRKWSANYGATSPVTVAGGSVFLVSDQAQLVRLDAATGAMIWAHDLPYYVKEKIKKQKEIYAHYGPILAGGKLFVASSDGVLRSFDPVSGAVIAQADLPGGAASAPVVAGSTLYVVSKDGQLLAYR
ncbi:quinoprotein [Thioclava sp. SK-1]|nr:PQQ-like beta-propeller repeat protein [Thioclava sp. SK-1]OCX66575.1 quinoprotein [Thioclava sp. SK-1]